MKQPYWCHASQSLFYFVPTRLSDKLVRISDIVGAHLYFQISSSQNYFLFSTFRITFFMVSDKPDLFIYWKQRCIISIITSCCSGVILLSLGKQSPRLKMSAPTSAPEPFMYAFVRPLPLPSTVTKGFVR